MLASANESANALACHVSGSREAFAELMNQTAESLGCTGSHFANPSGLNDENHYTTAHDMALITRAAIQNPDFLEIDGARNYKLPPTKRNLEGGYVANHHRMLVKNTSVYYPGAFAGKTGYTSIAGNTLVTCAEKNDMTLIAVVLNGHQTHYSDTKALFDGGNPRRFSSFASVALRKLDMLDAAKCLEDLRIPPANRLEQLKGDRAGQHSIRINAQWRICFIWENGAAHRVEIVDYH